MPGNFSAIDNSFPTLTGKESPREQIQKLLNYLYIMKQELRYMLNNLTPENWNEHALEQMAQQMQSAEISTIEAALKKLEEKVLALEETVEALQAGGTT